MSERVTFTFGQGPTPDGDPSQSIKMTEVPAEKRTRAGHWLRNKFASGRARYWEATNHPHAQPIDGSANRWGTEIIAAGRELFRRRTSKKFLIMGGQTDRDKGRSAESEVLERGIVDPFIKNEVRIPQTVTEKESSNTFENLVNICNQLLDKRGGPKKIDMLGASFHLTRMKILMKLFDIPYDRVIGASDVMLYAAQTAGQTDHATINDINARHDGNIVYHDTGLTRAVSDFGDEKSSAQKRAEEDLWTRVLLTEPAYSLPYFARIESDDRLMRILHNYDTKFFPAEGDQSSALQTYGINIGSDSPDVIREKLSGIKRKLPGEDERNQWIAEQQAGEKWPLEVENKFRRILGYEVIPSYYFGKKKEEVEI